MSSIQKREEERVRIKKVSQVSKVSNVLKAPSYRFFGFQLSEFGSSVSCLPAGRSVCQSKTDKLITGKLISENRSIRQAHDPEFIEGQLRTDN